MFSGIKFVEYNTFGQLYGQTIAVYGNLVDQITTLNANLLTRYQVLNDDVTHVFPESVSFAVQCVHSAEDNVIAGDCAILASDHLIELAINII